MKLVIIVLIFCTCVNSQRFLPGYCRPLPAVQNFDKNRFFGHWIEAEKTPSMFDMIMRCMEVDFTEDKDGSINVALKGSTLAGLPISITGDGLVQDVTKHGSYSVRYGFGVPFQGTLTTILDTDYKEYALVYSCTNSLLSGIFHTSYVWILTREGPLSNPTRQNIYELLDKLNIQRGALQISDRAICPKNETVGRESDDLYLTPTQLQ
ncbi:apolipoprotein D-like protein [Leptotrombidium deliense]|uniref:Apolipoprotein D-like protein n=1 Tax=Leptotrombidium deliense TaxID=299467 RepID=A0A443S9X0_9ACAR|nr:apolipoprotein D-like protein [Leptotrombidium deliense]